LKEILNKISVYRIKLKRKSTKEYDEINVFFSKDMAQHKYYKFMKEKYFYCGLYEVVNGKENNLASFCKSEFA
jgi:hypothetical protein